MQPHLDAAEKAKTDAVALKEQLRALKKRADATPDAIEDLETKIKEREKAARYSQGKADAIGNAVFDLKAVNPNIVVKVDTRTVKEVIQSIEDHNEVITKSLKALRSLLKG